MLIGLIALAAWPLSVATGREFGLGITGPSANIMQFLVTGDGKFINWGVFLVLGIFIGSFIGAKAVSYTHLQKTPKGAPSTNEEVLEELAFSHELPKVLVEHRGLSKLKSTYTDKLPQMVNPQTGRVHTSYHQAVTATGRLSSSDPNLQNIPIRNEEGRRIRQAFIAREGFTVVAADYSQIELRIMAHLSQDQGLINAFTQGKDIHQMCIRDRLHV